MHWAQLFYWRMMINYWLEKVSQNPSSQMWKLLLFFMSWGGIIKLFLIIPYVQIQVSISPQIILSKLLTKFLLRISYLTFLKLIWPFSKLESWLALFYVLWHSTKKSCMTCKKQLWITCSTFTKSLDSLSDSLEY